MAEMLSILQQILVAGMLRPAHLLDLIRNLQSRGAELLIISDDPAALEQAHFPLPIARGLPEWLTPLITVLPGQRFAMQLAIEKHLNVDQPEGLTKVTETL